MVLPMGDSGLAQGSPSTTQATRGCIVDSHWGPRGPADRLGPGPGAPGLHAITQTHPSFLQHGRTSTSGELNEAFAAQVAGLQAAWAMRFQAAGTWSGTAALGTALTPNRTPEYRRRRISLALGGPPAAPLCWHLDQRAAPPMASARVSHRWQSAAAQAERHADRNCLGPDHDRTGLQPH